MIDLHCHILPDVDDGPRNYMQFMEMARTAVNAGITTVFATPHHLNGHYANPKSKILERVAECNEHLKKENIPLNILPGQELRIHWEMFTSIEMDEILTLDNKGKYILLELPSSEVPMNTHEIIYELLLKGIIPIIAHPERNRGFIKNNELLFEFIKEGALAQITAASIIGQFGKKVKAFTEKIIKHHLAHFIATDAHNISPRGFFLQEAYAFVTKKYGDSYSQYFKENVEMLLLGQNIHVEQPNPIRKKI